MKHFQLSIDQAPPFSIPVRFFITAPLFGIAAVILLLFFGPQILQQRWLPQTIAVTHLITLGFITMTMIGALFQLLPVLAGASIYKAPLTSKLVHVLFTSGVILLVTGLYTGQQIFLRLSLTLLFPGLLLFLITASIGLVRTRSSHASVRGMRFALLGLWITVFMGLLLASGHGLDSVPLLRQHTGIHIAWALIGWVSIMIVSISYQVIPMFQVTAEYPQLFKKFFAPLLFIILMAWSILHWAGYESDTINLAVLSLVCLLFIVFISITLHLLLQRKKRMADASLYFWIFGLLMLPISLLMVYYGEITHSPIHFTAVVIFIGGFIISVINAMLYKILPFLVWLHLTQQLPVLRTGSINTPTMNEIIPARQAYHQFGLHVTAIICLPLAAYFPTLFFYPALLLLLVNWVLLEIHLLRAVQIYYRHSQ